MSAALEALARARVIAVVRVDAVEHAAPTVAALAAGGLRAIELTWTSPEPAAELARAREAHPADVLIGAGTLRSRADVEAAVAAGADFLVSPHFEPELFAAMRESGRLSLPGVFTPSEVAAALEAGAEAVKLFPASIGGIGHLKALLGPFPGLRVVPTGGVNAGNAGDWLAAGAVAVGAGGELCPAAAIAAGRWPQITDAASTFVRAAGGSGDA